MELGRERRRGRADRREGKGASRERCGAEGEGAGPASSSSSRHRAGGVRGQNVAQPASGVLRGSAATVQRITAARSDQLVAPAAWSALETNCLRAAARRVVQEQARRKPLFGKGWDR